VCTAASNNNHNTASVVPHQGCIFCNKPVTPLFQ
jgi:hypothetical protein